MNYCHLYYTLTKLIIDMNIFHFSFTLTLVLLQCYLHRQWRHLKDLLRETGSPTKT